MSVYLKDTQSNKSGIDTLEVTCLLFLISMNLRYLLDISQLRSILFVSNIERLLVAFGILTILVHNLNPQNGMMSVSEFVRIFIAVAIGFIAYWQSGGPTLIKLVLFWLGCRGVREDKVLKYEIVSLLIGLSIVVIPSLSGITLARYYKNPDVFTFGFVNPNNLPMIITAILISANLLMEEKKEGRILSLILQAVLVLVILHFTNSRSASIILLVFLFMSLLSLNQTGKEIIGKLFHPLPLAFTGLSVISYFIARLYRTDDSWLAFTKLLSWRPYLWNKYYRVAPITLFGNKLDELGALDNAYLVLLLQYGVVVLCVYCIAYYFVTSMALEKRRIMLLLAIFCYEVFYVFEYGPILVNVNPIILIYICLISSPTPNTETDLKKAMEV